MPTSLQSTQTAQGKVDEFVIKWKTPQNAHKTLVLVEGRDDRLFYDRFFHDETVSLQDCGGCNKLGAVYWLLQKTSIINIAIKDSDFARLNGTPVSGNNFFYTDAHDYEMMCLSNEQSRKELFENMIVKDGEKLMEEVFRDLTFLSYFKWYNYTYRSNYNFRVIKVSELDACQLCDYQTIHDKSYPVSKNPILIEREALNGFISERCNCNCYELVNGHDFLNRLCWHIKRKYPDVWTNLNEGQIQNILRPCFRFEAFAETNLYKAIRDWETGYSKRIFIDSVAS